MDSSKISCVADPVSFDDLPSEVFERIISFLNVEDRKVVSLVNGRWAEFAFSRIALSDVLLEINCAQRDAHHFWLVLENSSRNYRNIVLKFAEDEDGYLLKILDKFQDSLESVSIEQDADARLLHAEVSVDYFIELLHKLVNVRELKVKTVMEVYGSADKGMKLPHLERLEAICLYTHCLEKDWIDWIAIAPNVRSIGVPLVDGQDGFPKVIKHFCGQLSHLSIDARFIEHDALSFCQQYFPEVTKFRLLYPINTVSVANFVRNFMQTCSQLTDVNLFKNTICSETLQTLAEYCTQLQVVSLDANEIPQTTFVILCKLRKLKQLILHKATVEPAMITSSGCFASLTQLTCLSIRVNVPDAFFEQLHKKMPRLTVLELLDRFRFGISNFNQTGVVSSICSHMRNLTRLALVDWAILDVSIFAKLNMLDNLTDLRVKCIGLNADKALPVCSRVKKLMLDVDSLKPVDIIPPVSRAPLAEILAGGFPALNTFELRKNFLDKTAISEQQIAALSIAMPQCTFYRKTSLKMADKDYAALL